MIQDKRILVTGGTGFIGSHIIKQLCANNQVYCLTRNPPPEFQMVKCIKGDLRDFQAIRLPHDIDMVIHLAGVLGSDAIKDVSGSYQVNVCATVDLLRYALDTSAELFVFASTGGVYGYQNEPVNETFPKRNPVDLYASQKVIAENWVMAFGQDMPVLIPRYFFPYGVGQTGRFIPNLIERIRKGEPIFVEDRRINPIYIEDAVALTLALAERKETGTFNIAGPDVVRIREVAEAVAAMLTLEVDIRDSSSDLQGDMVGDIQKAIERTGYDSFMPFSEGLRKVVEGV